MGIMAYRFNSGAGRSGHFEGGGGGGLVVVALTQSSIQVQSGGTSLGYIDSASVFSTGGLGIFSDLQNCSHGPPTILHYCAILM